MGIHEIVVDYALTNALIIEERYYSAQLILLELSKFDLILDMDWLGEHDVHIDCKKKELGIGCNTRYLVTIAAQKPQTDKIHISTLRGSDHVYGTDQVFLVF